MSASRTNFQLGQLTSYRGPGLFLAGGMLAGLLLFLVWLASLPSTGKTSPAAQPAASSGVIQGPLTAGDSVLSGITGAPNPGQPNSMLSPDEEVALIEEGSGEEIAEATEEAHGDFFSAPVIVDDERAIASGVLDDPAPMPSQVDPVLQTYFVEVMPEPGVLELLEVNAESVEHARAIIRDFRGNPRISRGPTTEPLD